MDEALKIGRKLFCVVFGHNVFIYNAEKEHTIYASCKMCRTELAEVKRFDSYKRSSVLMKRLSSYHIRKMTLKGF